MARQLTGGCLCGTVKYTLEDRFKGFYQCHCRQCQQMTGSAFASNIFTDPDNITWLSGQENVSIYKDTAREFGKAFCNICGSALPYINKSGTSLVVPAGSLNELPRMPPQANIFTAEEALWLESGRRAVKFSGFPD